MELLLKLYPEFVRVYGPYIHSGLQRRVVYLENSNGTRKAITYARALLQIKFDRRFTWDETVDHIDDDKLNDDICNLQLLSRSENSSKNSLGFGLYVCPECDIEFEKLKSTVRKNRWQNKAGPFCGRSCAGKYSKKLTLANN